MLTLIVKDTSDRGAAKAVSKETGIPVSTLRRHLAEAKKKPPRAKENPPPAESLEDEVREAMERERAAAYGWSVEDLEEAMRLYRYQELGLPLPRPKKKA